MYLQITTKCNMKCSHCCYNCTMRGKHMEWNTFIDAVSFMRNWSESISIGGGEPTLHPRFFDILKVCLDDFDYVWMATNGSQTETMQRLAAIIDGEDSTYLIDNGEYCDCTEEEIEDDECYCYEKAYDDVIYQKDKLSVALSQDCFHDPIDGRIVQLWARRASVHRHSHFEIRDASQYNSGIIAQGRAKKTGAGWNENDCVCPDMIIKPNGKIKLCGCTNAPIIGDVWNGIKEKWEEILQDDGFQDTNCYNQWKKGEGR